MRETEQPTKEQIEIWRRMESWQRLQVAFELYDFAWRMVTLQLREGHPNWTEEQVRAEVLRRFHPELLYESRPG